MLRNTKILLGAVALLLGASLEAQAQVNGPYCGGGYWFGPPYNYSQQEHLPYYSLHPPVYYSLPVARSYGYSPWAYPPGTMTPEVQIAEPLEIQNPYVPRTKEKPGVRKGKPASDKTTFKPYTLINPFVAQAGKPAVALTQSSR